MSADHRSALNPFYLKIGSLTLSLSCPAPALQEHVYACYGNYAGQGPAQFHAMIEIEESPVSASLLETPPIFHQGTARFVAPGCRASIDPHRGEGELILGANQPTVQLDYYLRIAAAMIAFESGGLLFHAAAVVRRGVGWVFFGYSGSGKSTVARLSISEAALQDSPGATAILNDDLVLLAPDAGGWRVYATPFWNQPAKKPPIDSAPIAGLFRLVQDRRAYLELLTLPAAVAEMLTSVPVVSADPDRSAVLVDRCQGILSGIPAYRLHFLPDPSFWALLDREL